MKDNFIYLIKFPVVVQDYEADFFKTDVILGNSALLKCDIPSFVADFISIEGWIDSEDNEYFPGLSSGRKIYHPLLYNGETGLSYTHTAIRSKFLFNGAQLFNGQLSK